MQTPENQTPLKARHFPVDVRFGGVSLGGWVGGWVGRWIDMKDFTCSLRYRTLKQFSIFCSVCYFIYLSN